MKNAIKLGAVAATAALALAACGSAPDAQSGDSSASGSGGGASKACMVSDSGGFEDKSFNQSGHEGMERAAKELGVATQFAESQSDADFQPNIDSMVQGGCDLIVGVGFLMADVMRESAVAYPDIKFALVDSTFADPDAPDDPTPENSKALVFNTAEASYLAGYVAAGMSESGKVAAYVGAAIPSTNIFVDGFADGVKKYNEAKGTNIEMLGGTKEKQDYAAVGNFEDTAKGKQLTEGFIQQGADVIMPVAGPVGAGTLAAAKDSGKASVIWVDADGFETQPEFGNLILTSVMKEIGQAVFDTVKSVQDGSWTHEDYVGDIKNGGVAIAPFHDFDSKVPAELKDEVKKLEEQIASGELKVETPNAP